jgi:hypothetical protein
MPKSEPQPKTILRGDSAEKQALAQIEKWMAVIRDIGREDPRKHHG